MAVAQTHIGSCIYMCARILRVAGSRGGQLHLHHSFDRLRFRRCVRPEATTLPCARARERWAKARSVVLDAIFDEDHDGEVAESSFSSRPAAPRIR